MALPIGRPDVFIEQGEIADLSLPEGTRFFGVTVFLDDFVATDFEDEDCGLAGLAHPLDLPKQVGCLPKVGWCDDDKATLQSLRPLQAPASDTR